MGVKLQWVWDSGVESCVVSSDDSSYCGRWTSPGTIPFQELSIEHDGTYSFGGFRTTTATICVSFLKVFCKSEDRTYRKNFDLSGIVPV